MKSFLIVFFLILNSLAYANSQVVIRLKLKNKDVIQVFYTKIIDGEPVRFSEKQSIKRIVESSENFQTLVFDIPEEMVPFSFRIDFGNKKNEFELKDIKLEYQDKSMVWSGYEIWQDFRVNGHLINTKITNTSFHFGTETKNNRVDVHMYLWPKAYRRLTAFFNHSELIESIICIETRVAKNSNFYIIPYVNEKISEENYFKNQILHTDSIIRTCFYLYTSDRIDGFRIDLGNKPKNRLEIKSISFEDYKFSITWTGEQILSNFSFNYLDSVNKNQSDNISMIIDTPGGKENAFITYNGLFIPFIDLMIKKALLLLLIVLCSFTFFYLNRNWLTILTNKITNIQV